MSCTIWVIYFVGLVSPMLVNGFGRECDEIQTVLTKEGSTATFEVNVTHTGTFDIMVHHREHSPGDVAYITSGHEATEFKFLDDSWNSRVNLTYRLTNDMRNIRINLDNVSMYDIGIYKLLRQPYWRSLACFNLSFLSGPSDMKVVPRKKHHVLVGGDILPDITCTSECNPSCNITWGKHSEGNILSLGAVTTEDTGEYTCTATTIDGQTAEQTISIFVVRPSPRLVLVPGQIYYNLVTGDTMPDITCTSECNPPCNITWGKHGVGNILRLAAVTTEDTGEYTCTATRSDGRIVQTSISIYVTDKTYYMQAIVCLGTVQVLAFLVFGVIIFVIYKRRNPSCCHQHNESKKANNAATKVTFSKSTTQGSEHENYEELTDETRNMNKTYSELSNVYVLESGLTSGRYIDSQDLKDNMTQPSLDTYENTLDRK